MPAADFIEQGVGFCVGHRGDEAGLGDFGIIFHLDGDEDVLKLIHGSSLSNHIFVGLTEHSEVNGIAGNFHLDILHCSAVGEVGGSENGGSDEGEGGDSTDDGLFHGGISFPGWKMGIKIAPQQVAGRFWNNIQFAFVRIISPLTIFFTS